MKGFESILNSAKLATPWDIVDILIVAFLVYRLMRFLRNTSAQKLFQGLIALLVLLELSDVLQDVLDTPVSPELLPPKDGEISQKTEDLVGPYELHD